MRAAVLSLVFLAFAAISSAGETLSCGNSVVTLPVSLDELLRKCGQPLRKEVTTDEIRTAVQGGVASRPVGTTTTEKWTYQRSGQSLPMVVTVVDGKVTDIERQR
jgi:hypothetical protein